jgi:aquaglyceroporin related protein
MDGRKPTATSAMSRSNTNQTQHLSDAQRLEKKQQQTVDVEEEYMKLNPWYNEQKEKPVFGLGQPLPHTMRRGMWWGRSDLKKKLDKLKEEENQIREEMEGPQYSEKGECDIETEPWSQARHRQFLLLTCQNRLWSRF